MSETQTTTPTPTDASDATVTTNPNQPTLGIDDIKNAVKIIDFAADNGAFKGWKVIEQVLVVRNRLNNFTKAVAPDETPAPAVSSSDTTEDSKLSEGQETSFETTQDNSVNE